MVNTAPDNKQLRTQTLNSAGWSAGAKFFRQFIQFFFQILLARMLAPEDFGLLSMILVFSALADILKNLGLGAAIIQRPGITPAHLNTVFWTNLMAGAILFFLFQLAAPFIAAFYKIPQLEDVTRVYAVIYLVGSLNVVQEALMYKDLQFKRLFFIEAAAVLIGGIVALVLASYNFGVWTLVGQYLCISVVSTLVLWITSNWSPSFQFNREALNDFRRYGSNLLGHDLLSFLSRNIDNVFIGRFLGPAALGIYSRAYFFMLQPINITSQVLARVMFPVFSKMQHDHNYIRSMYLKSTRLVAYFVFPAITYVFIMSYPLIEVLLGSKWLGVAPILQIFCVYSLIDTIGVTTTWIYKALGRTDTMFRWAIYSTIVIIASIIIGLNWGIQGVAISYTTGFLVFLWLPGWYFAFRLINLRPGRMLHNLLPVFAATMIAGIFMCSARYLLENSLPAWLLCMIVFASGFVFYFTISAYLDKPSFSFVKTIVHNIFKRLRPDKSKTTTR